MCTVTITEERIATANDFARLVDCSMNHRGSDIFETKRNDLTIDPRRGNGNGNLAIDWREVVEADN